MNKLKGFLLSVALVLGLSLPCWADQIQGVIESVSGNSITIKDPVSGEGKTVRVHSKVASGAKSGDIAKATLKPGTDEADTVELLTSR